jgi:hypothetical protein
MGARTTTSTMFGVRRTTSCTTGAQFVVERGESAQPARVRSAGLRAPACAKPPDSPASRWPIAFTTLPANDGMQIAEEADGAAVGRTDISTCDGFGLGDALRLHRLAVLVDGLEIAAVEHDVVLVLAASTVLGCVPAATRMVISRAFARRIIILPASSARMKGRSAAAWPKRSTSTSSGVRHSANGRPLQAPWRLPRGSACSWARRSAGGGRRW